MNVNKIGICMPSAGNIFSKTAYCLIDTIIKNKHIDFIPIFQQGAYIPENREKLVSRAIENKCTHIWFVDHDMVFDHLALPLLLAAEKDIIAAPYNYKRFPKETMINFLKEKQNEENIFEVQGMPTGCMLIKTEVFEKLKKPYFQMEYDKDGFVITSEDIGFCNKARDAGFKIWCNPTIDIKHLGIYEY